MDKLKSLLRWFTGLRSWDKCWVCGLGAVLALSIALLYGKITKSDDPDELARNEFANAVSNSSTTPSVWFRVSDSRLGRLIRDPTNRFILIAVGVIVVVWVFHRKSDPSPPHHESDDDVKW